MKNLLLLSLAISLLPAITVFVCCWCAQLGVLYLREEVFSLRADFAN